MVVGKENIIYDVRLRERHLFKESAPQDLSGGTALCCILITIGDDLATRTRLFWLHFSVPYSSPGGLTFKRPGLDTVSYTAQVSRDLVNLCKCKSSALPLRGPRSVARTQIRGNVTCNRFDCAKIAVLEEGSATSSVETGWQEALLKAFVGAKIAVLCRRLCRRLWSVEIGWQEALFKAFVCAKIAVQLGGEKPCMFILGQQLRYQCWSFRISNPVSLVHLQYGQRLCSMLLFMLKLQRNRNADGGPFLFSKVLRSNRFTR